jgi:hypothetical protein
MANYKPYSITHMHIIVVYFCVSLMLYDKIVFGKLFKL